MFPELASSLYWGLLCLLLSVIWISWMASGKLVKPLVHPGEARRPSIQSDPVHPRPYPRRLLLRAMVVVGRRHGPVVGRRHGGRAGRIKP